MATILSPCGSPRERKPTHFITGRGTYKEGLGFSIPERFWGRLYRLLKSWFPGISLLFLSFREGVNSIISIFSPLPSSVLFLCRGLPTLLSGILPSSMQPLSHVGFLFPWLEKKAKRGKRDWLWSLKPPERPSPSPLFLTNLALPCIRCVLPPKYLSHSSREGTRRTLHLLATSHLVLLLFLLSTCPWFCPVLHFKFLFCVELAFFHIEKMTLPQEPI